WAVVDRLDTRQTVRLAGAHRDPTKEPLLRELSDRYPAYVGSAAPAPQVLTSGAPLDLPDIDDVLRRSSAVDDHHAELIAQLGTRSAIVVPLVARGALIGSLTLSAATPHRYAPADVEMAAELGRRAALAIDNASLYGERLRAEAAMRFLADASRRLV